MSQNVEVAVVRIATFVMVTTSFTTYGSGEMQTERTSCRRFMCLFHAWSVRFTGTSLRYRETTITDFFTKSEATNSNLGVLLLATSVAQCHNFVISS